MSLAELRLKGERLSFIVSKWHVCKADLYFPPFLT